MSNIPKSKRKPTQFQLFIDLSNIRHQLTEYICHDFSNENITYIRGTNNYKAVKQLDNLFFQLFNLKYEDLRKWQKQQTKALKMSLQKSLTQNMQD